MMNGPVKDDSNPGATKTSSGLEPVRGSLAGERPSAALSLHAVAPDSSDSRAVDAGAGATLAARPQSGDLAASTGGEPESLTGQTLSGRYLLDACIGEGAMGAVYRATHTLMKKRVAIKVLHAHVAQNKEILERFQREAQAAAHIEHINICGATDFGQTPDGMFFMVMEYLDGQSLEDLLQKEGALEMQRALNITDQIASALTRAHGLGIVHRDLKPDNVFLVESELGELVKIVDFGIARVYLDDDEDLADRKLTQAGMVYGTPHYLSPEQASGEAVTPQADLYALGVMLYEMLTGRRPFEGNLRQLLAAHMTRNPPPMGEVAPDKGIPAGVESLVERMLAKQLPDRTKSADELRRELALYRDDQSTMSGAIPMPSFNSGSNPVPEIPDAKPTPAKGSSGSLLDTLASKAEGVDPRILIGAGAGILLLMVIVIVLIATSGGDSDSAGTIDESADAETEEPVAGEDPPILATDFADALAMRYKADADVAAAIALIKSGDVEDGAVKLTALRETKYAGDRDFAIYNAATLMSMEREGKAVEIISPYVTIEPAVLEQQEVEDMLVQAVAVEKRDRSGPAYELLKSHMTDDIAVRLAELAATGEIDSRKRLRKRVKVLFDTHKRWDALPAWQKLAIELRALDRAGCYKRRDKIQEIADLGDPKALPALKIIRANRKERCNGKFDEIIAILEAKR